MKSKKLHSPDELVGRVVSYVAFVEQHRGMLKDVGGNTKPVLAGLEERAHGLKPLIEKVDKVEREFLAMRNELKALAAELEVALTDQLTYAREYAKHHRLTMIREGLKAFGRQRTQKRPTAEAAPGDAAAKPGA